MLTIKAEDRLFNALADRTRRRIVRALAKEPLAVHRITSEFRVTRPAISRHLRILKEAGLVDVSEAGRENLYYLKTSTLREVEDWLNAIWAKRLATLKALVEEEPDD
ncbi:MAG: metalloregulator ArsR/SmtB family transcription factor [Pseudomonadota bacterium]